MCRKVVSLYEWIIKTQHESAPRPGVTQELLSLVTSLAHYSKLLIRIGLQGCLHSDLDLERGGKLKTTVHLEVFLGAIEGRGTDLTALFVNASRLTRLRGGGSDLCVVCKKPAEAACFHSNGALGLLHEDCLTCTRCGVSPNWSKVKGSPIRCANCQAMPPDMVHFTRTEQYVFLLAVALARLTANMGLDAAEVFTASNQSPSSGSGEVNAKRDGKFKVLESKDNTGKAKIELVHRVDDQKRLALDDIPKLVAAEAGKGRK